MFAFLLPRENIVKKFVKSYKKFPEEWNEEKHHKDILINKRLMIGIRQNDYKEGEFIITSFDNIDDSFLGRRNVDYIYILGFFENIIVNRIVKKITIKQKRLEKKKDKLEKKKDKNKEEKKRTDQQQEAKLNIGLSLDRFKIL